MQALEALRRWLCIARVVRGTCQNPQEFDELIACQELWLLVLELQLLLGK